MKKISTKKGFTLLELLIIVAIVAILAVVMLEAMGISKLRALDAKRISEIKSIQTALEEYHAAHGSYPPSDSDCGGWDVGNQDYEFLSNIKEADMPEDPKKSGSCAGYRYYLYEPGSYGCPSGKGAFYVLGISDLESRPRPAKESPGWSCPGRDWQVEMDWVTGMFES